MIRWSVGAGIGSVFGNWWYSSSTSPSDDRSGSSGIGSEMGSPSAAAGAGPDELWADETGASNAAASAPVAAATHQRDFRMTSSLPTAATVGTSL